MQILDINPNSNLNLEFISMNNSNFPELYLLEENLRYILQEEWILNVHQAVLQAMQAHKLLGLKA